MSNAKPKGPVSKKKVKDENAPKRPLNAYTIFFKHYVEQFNKKNPNNQMDTRLLIAQIAKAWKGLKDDERQPFQEKARKEKERYEQDMEEYKKTADYRKFMKKQNEQLPDVEVFSKEFLQHNKAKEADLRNLRKEIGALETKAGPIVDRIRQVQSQIETLEHQSGPKSGVRKERLMNCWIRKLIPELQRTGLLEELGLQPSCSADQFVTCMERATHDPRLTDRLRTTLDGLYLPVAPE